MDDLRWTIGAVEIIRVVEMVLPVPPSVVVPRATGDLVERHRDWLGPFFDADGNLNISIHSFVVVTPSVTIVVDTCFGLSPARGVPGDPTFPERLGAVVAGGLGGVDMVLCTHLHGDHVGWNTRVGHDGVIVPTFPNARYLIADDELRHNEVDDPMIVREQSVAPLLALGVIDACETDRRLCPEVRLVPTPGHSPGHVSVLIESRGESALITGDAVHTPLQFAYPELAAEPVDWNTEQSTATRRALVARLADADTLVLGTHFATPTAGFVRRRETGAVWFAASS